MRHTLSLVGTIAIALSATGCAGLSVPFVGSESEIVRATATNPVMEVLMIWEPGEGRGLDNLPSRGLAGQLMFFTYRKATPALVEGDVTVYLFDDHGSEAEQSKPLWQRTFTAAEWNAFAIQTNLGTAYQLFVPYVRKGRHEAHCSVRIKLEPAGDGPPVFSKMAHVTLPGPKSEKQVSTLRHQRIEPKRFDADGANSLQPVPEQQSEQQTASSQSGLRTTTLPVPGQQRISPDTTARLQQLAQEMVHNQQQQNGIQQAGYTTTDADLPGNDGESAEPPSGERYRLYR